MSSHLVFLIVGAVIGWIVRGWRTETEQGD